MNKLAALDGGRYRDPAAPWHWHSSCPTKLSGRLGRAVTRDAACGQWAGPSAASWAELKFDPRLRLAAITTRPERIQAPRQEGLQLIAGYHDWADGGDSESAEYE